MMRHLLLFILLLLQGHAQEDGLIRSISELRALNISETAEGRKVELRATVLTAMTERGSFIHDGREGIYLGLHEYEGELPRLSLGDDILVRGVVHGGQFFPHLLAYEIEIYGKVPLPDPQQLSNDELLDPYRDCQFVTFEGIIVEVSTAESIATLVAKVQRGTRIWLVRFPEGMTTKQEVEKYLHRKLRLKLIAATTANARRQITSRYFVAPTLDFFQVLEDEEEASADAYPLSSVLQKDSAFGESLTVFGTVIGSHQRDLILKSGDDGLMVRLPKVREFQKGEIVEARGYPIIQNRGPELLAFEAGVSGEQEPPTPQPISLASPEFTSLLNLDYVTLEAKVERIYQSPGSVTLQCISEGRVFEATLEGFDSVPRDLTPDCVVRLTGVSNIYSELDLPTGFTPPETFSLTVYEESGISIIEKAPWWTFGKLLTALSLLLAFAGLAVLWIRLLRKKVAAQTRALRKIVEKEAIMHERQRVARELHDSLQQNLSAVSMQVECAAMKFQGVNADAEELLGKVDEMLVECQEETRRSINQLRNAEVTRGSLAVYLQDAMQEEAREAGVDLKIMTEGEPVELDTFVVRNVLKIVREAFNNALTHARATKVALTFIYEPNKLQVVLTDNGQGFAKNREALPGHYGLTGMHERSESINAQLDINSAMGKGTEVTLLYPFS